MTVFFRCDVGGLFGLGHSHRLKTLATALHAEVPGLPLVFVTTTSALGDIVGQDGTPWSLLSCLDEWTACETVRTQAQPGDVMIFDEPARGSWVKGLWRQKLAPEIAVVRIDAPQAERYSCDLLILPGAHYAADDLERLDAAFGERLLVGAEYVLLRKETLVPSHGAFMHHPWFTFWAGGSDPGNALALLLHMTTPVSQCLPHVQHIYCMGIHRASLVVPPVPPQVWITGCDISYIREASVFVSLWGTTVYEALALGTPTLTIARTEAEAEDAARLEAATEGAVQSLGTLAGLMRETLCDRLVALWEDVGERKRMHYASAGLLDGKGAERVARAVLRFTKGVNE